MNATIYQVSRRAYRLSGECPHSFQVWEQLLHSGCHASCANLCKESVKNLSELLQRKSVDLQSRMTQEYGNPQDLSESERDLAPNLPYDGSSAAVHNVSAPASDRGTSAMTLKSGSTMTVS